MYEVTLKSHGIMQIGWCTPTCICSNEEGVGDSPDSYAFDGQRRRLWNVGSIKYGQKWVAGDVIGCCIDATQGYVQFYRNGVALSTVTHVRPGLTYYPAMSLSQGERCRVNFGHQPMRVNV